MCVCLCVLAVKARGRRNFPRTLILGGRRTKPKKSCRACLIGKLPKLSSSSSLTLLSLWITFPGSVRTGWAGRSAAGERLGGSGRSAA